MKEQITFSPDSTQQFIEIDEIKNDVIILKDGSMRAILMVSGINFELKSEEEQDMITGAYQNFLNTLNFSLQIIIHSRKINIDNYLSFVKDKLNKEGNALLRNQIDEYTKFISEFIKNNEIMSKSFFVVIPYQSTGIKNVKKGLFSMLGKKKSKADENEESFEGKLTQLQQRIDQVVSGLSRIGLRAVRLNKEELMELYYNLYNPGNVEKKFAGNNGDQDEKDI